MERSQKQSVQTSSSNTAGNTRLSKSAGHFCVELMHLCARHNQAKFQQIDHFNAYCLKQRAAVII